MPRIRNNRFQQKHEGHGGFLPRRLNIGLLVLLVLMVIHLMQSSITDPPKPKTDSIGLKSPKSEDDSKGPSYKQMLDLQMARMENIGENGEVEGDDDSLEIVEFLKAEVAYHFETYHYAIAAFRDQYLSLIEDQIEEIRPDIANIVDDICGDKIQRTLLPSVRNAILNRLDTTTMMALKERHQFHLQEEAETTHNFVADAEELGLTVVEISGQLIEHEEETLNELDEIIQADMLDIANGLYEDMLVAAQFILEELFDNLGKDIDLVIAPEGLELVEYDGGKKPITMLPAEEVEAALMQATIYEEAEDLLDDDMLQSLDDDFFYLDLHINTDDEYIYSDQTESDQTEDVNVTSFEVNSNHSGDANNTSVDGDDDEVDNADHKDGDGDDAVDDDAADGDDDTSDNGDDAADTTDGDDDASDYGDDDAADTTDGDDDASDTGDDDATDGDDDASDTGDDDATDGDDDASDTGDDDATDGDDDASDTGDDDATDGNDDASDNGDDDAADTTDGDDDTTEDTEVQR